MTGKLLNSFLETLQVPHTYEYTVSAFDSMSFKSLFGLSRLLGTYGVDTQAYDISASTERIDAFTPPLLARLGSDFVVLTELHPHSVSFIDEEGTRTLPRSEFMHRFKGVVLAAFPTPEAAEPLYRQHRFTQWADSSKKWILAALALFLIGCGVTGSGIYRHPWFCAAGVTYLIGLYACILLFLKSHGINLAQADNICGAIERTGCHSVLSTSGAKFYGIFGWAEVGLAYFMVNTAVILLFPSMWQTLAVINVIVCPFSLWSVWYQKYRAKAWCTLCLIVQACMWLGLACWLFSAVFRHLNVSIIKLVILAAVYAAVMLSANALGNLIDKIENQKS